MKSYVQAALPVTSEEMHSIQVLGHVYMTTQHEFCYGPVSQPGHEQPQTGPLTFFAVL